MSESTKCVLYFLTGVIIGAAGGVLAVRGYYQKKEELDVQEVVDYYDQTYRSSKASKGKTEASEKTMKMVEKSNEAKEEKLIEDVKLVETPFTNYADVFDKVKNGDDSAEEDVNEDHPNEDEEREPHLITFDEYIEVIPYYDKVEAVYDKTQHCLVNKSTEEELEIDKCIGFVIYDMIEERVRNGAYLYVRNNQFGVDYEIEVREED